MENLTSSIKNNRGKDIQPLARMIFGSTKELINRTLLLKITKNNK